MRNRFSKQTVKDYLVERIEFLEQDYSCHQNDRLLIGKNEKILKSYGEYSALVKALYDLLKVVY